jgi:hypothetical protein
MRTWLVLVALGLSTAAVADPAPVRAPAPRVTAPAPAHAAGGDCESQRKAGGICVLKMGDEAIDGRSPTGGDIGAAILQFKTASSLIHIRRDFLAEITKTAEDL